MIYVDFQQAFDTEGGGGGDFRPGRKVINQTTQNMQQLTPPPARYNHAHPLDKHCVFAPIFTCKKHVLVCLSMEVSEKEQHLDPLQRTMCVAAYLSPNCKILSHICEVAIKLRNIALQQVSKLVLRMHALNKVLLSCKIMNKKYCETMASFKDDEKTIDAKIEPA